MPVLPIRIEDIGRADWCHTMRRIARDPRFEIRTRHTVKARWLFPELEVSGQEYEMPVIAAAHSHGVHNRCGLKLYTLLSRQSMAYG